MGYTHYYTPKAASEDKFKEFAMACKTLHKALPTDIIIRGGNGEGKPLFRNDEVWFNGDATDALEHETFYIGPKELDWSFCKTAGKPYDLLVVACLIAAHEILGYEVSSDGRMDEWKDGIDFYMKTIYTDMPDEEGTKAILPEFLFEGEGGDEYEKSYSVFDYVKSLFVVVD